MNCYNLKTDFGAVGDGVTNDYTAIMSFLNQCMINNRPGYIPAGRYLSNTRITINADNQSSSRTGLQLFGAGTHSSIFVISDSTGPSFHLYKGTGGVFSFVNFRDFGIECNSSQGFVVGLSDYSDWLGNGVFKNLHIYNQNSSNNDNAVVCQLNYIFDCIFENCVFITNTSFDYGVALELRNPKFTVFSGGAYSNAKIGISMPNSGLGRGCENLTFISADIENTNYCVRNTNTYTKRIVFTAPYFDNRRPDTSELGIACISSPAVGKKGCLVFDNPEFAIPGTGLYPDLDRAVDIANSNPGAIHIRGVYENFQQPSQPSSSPYTVTNGPQKACVNVSESKYCIVKINNVIIPGNVFILNPGDIFSLEWFGTAPNTRWTIIP